MADLYGTTSPRCSPIVHEEDMSSILHDILHNSSAQETSSTAAGLFSRSAVALDHRVGEGFSTAVLDSSATFNLSDPDGYFPIEVSESTRNGGSMVGGLDSDVITTMRSTEGFTGLEGSNVAVNPVLPRSSKRSRPSEIHNLSEKRRRSRINEKIRALQKLIPNSNKTDKASMLDEAIEYLKQLQLQVQMLTMRNGLGLHSINLPGSLQPMQLPQMGMNFDEENGLLNTNRGADTFFGNQEIPRRTTFEILNYTSPTQPIVNSSLTNITNLGTSFGLESSIQTQYGLPIHLTSSKDMCRDDTLSRLQLDVSCSKNNSSPGVSS